MDAETSGSNITEAMLLDYSYSNINNPVTASITSTNKPKVSDGLVHPDTGRQYGKSMLFTSGSSALHDGHDTRGATSARFQVTNNPNSYNFSISSSFSLSIWAKNPWRRYSISLIILLIGYFLGSSLGMVSAVVELMDPVAAFLSVVFIEILIALRRNFRFAREKKFLVLLLDSLRLGLFYGFFTESLKLL